MPDGPHNYQAVVTYTNAFPTAPSTSKMFFGIISLQYQTNLAISPNGQYEVVLTIPNATSISASSLIINANYASSNTLDYLQLSILILGNECKYFSYISSTFLTYSSSSSSTTVTVPFKPLRIFPLLRQM
jgi:hypothetical protein